MSVHIRIIEYLPLLLKTERQNLPFRAEHQHQRLEGSGECRTLAERKKERRNMASTWPLRRGATRLQPNQRYRQCKWWNRSNTTNVFHVFQAASALRMSPVVETDGGSEQNLHLCSLHSYSPAPASPTTRIGRRIICPQSPVSQQINQRAPRVRAWGHLWPWGSHGLKG